MTEAKRIREANGKLGVLMPGMGAVATTLIAGVEIMKKGLAEPVGSLSQMGTIRLGKRTEERVPKIKDFVPLAPMDGLVFGGWYAFPDDAYEAAAHADVLHKDHLNAVHDELRAVKPFPAVFNPGYVARINATHKKEYDSLREAAEQVREDIRSFESQNDLERAVMVNCASTEAYAQLKEGVPYANGAPSLVADIPALVELADNAGVPVAGKDFKTGQTLMKTIVAPGLKARMLGMEGWYSTNILGNRDGEVLDDEKSLKSKEVSKLSVLESILDPEKNPELYGNISHVVKINYYPPRGDAKEGWDNIDIFGWLG